MLLPLGVYLASYVSLETLSIVSSRLCKVFFLARVRWATWSGVGLGGVGG